MTARLITQIATYGMDFISLATLAATSEVLPQTWVVVPSLLALSILSRWKTLNFIFRFRDSRIFFFLFSLISIAAGLTIWLKLHTPLIVAVASSAPILHASLWLMSERSSIARASQLRLALGFMELIITSILTADVYLTFAIFIFTLLAALAISCNFLDKAFEENHEDLGQLSSRYVTRIFSVAFLVLLSAAVIFPLLPRTHLNGPGVEAPAQKVGYTEKVNLDQGTLFGGKGGKVLMRISQRKDSVQKTNEVATLIPFLLIRAKALDKFDGKGWHEGTHSSRRPVIRHIWLSRPKAEGKLQWLTVFREPIGSEVLPIPYGTEITQLQEGATSASYLRSGEWVNVNTAERAVRYDVGSRPGEFLPPSDETDVPVPEQLELVDEVNNEAIKELAKKIFASRFTLRKESAELYVAQITKFLSHFSYSLEGDSEGNERFPLLKFLFTTHKGNCKLYATAAAILLRIQKVPTRLITGFRVTRQSEQGVMRVRSSDAHTWIEYYQPKKGWTLYDPTPRTIMTLSLWDRLQDAYDLLESLWYNYAYTYDASHQVEMGYNAFQRIRDSKSWVLTKNNWTHLIETISETIRKSLVFVALAFTLFVIYLIFSSSQWRELLFHRNGNTYFKLRRSKARIEKFIRKKVSVPKKTEIDVFRQDSTVMKFFGPAARDAYLQWQSHYLTARFGPSDTHAKKLSREIRNLENQFKSLVRLALKSKLNN